jgi:nitrite reductase (NADH) small subunit
MIDHHPPCPAEAGLYWVRVTACDNIPTREGRAVTIGGREIAIFNLGDGFLATDNRCPHQGGPLCDGIVTGTSVVCPLHAWKVSLTSGSVERPSIARDHCVAIHPVRVEDGIVVVGLPVTRDAGAPREDAGRPGTREVAA